MGLQEATATGAATAAPAPRRGPDPAVEVVERGLIAFAVVWQLAWIWADPRLWPWEQDDPLKAAAIVATGVTVLAVVATTWGPEQWQRWRHVAEVVNVAALAGAALLFMLGPGSGLAEWPADASLVNVTVSYAGLRLAARIALVITAAGAVIEVLSLTLGEHGDEPHLHAYLYGLYAVTLGVAATASSTTLRRASRSVAAAYDDLLRTAMAARVTEAVARDTAARERLLHDSVLNTLTAVSWGVRDDRVRDVERTCADAARDIRALGRTGTPEPGLAHPSPGAAPDVVPPTRLARALADARASGARTEVALGALAPVPEPERHVLLDAAAEAVRNAARHAHATRVSVTAAPSAHAPDGVVLTVTDDGQGMDLAASERRLGIDRSIRGAVEGIGGSVLITSPGGAGTSVRIAWSPTLASLADEHYEAHAAEVTTLVAPAILLPTIVLSVASLVASWDEYPLVGWTAAGMAVFLALAVWLSVSGVRRRRLTWWDVAAVCIATPVVYLLEQRALDGVSPDVWSSWSSEAMSATLLVVVMVGPTWAWVAALGSWWATLGFDPLEIVRPGGALLVAGALFARAVRRQAHSYERTRDEAAVAAAELVAAARALEVSRARFATLEQTALPLLDSLADGVLDPRDPVVQARCAEEERFVRTLVRVDTTRSPVFALVVQLAVVARARRVALDVHAPESLPQVGQDGLDEARRLLFADLDQLPPGTKAQLTVDTDDDEVVVHLVAHRPVPLVAVGQAAAVATDEDEPLWREVRIARVP